MIQPRPANFLGKMAQAESIKSAREGRAADLQEAQYRKQTRSALAGALQGDKESLNTAFSLDPKSAEKISKELSKRSKAQLEKESRQLGIIATALKSSKTPREYKMNLEAAYRKNLIPKEVYDSSLEDFQNKDTLMMQALGFKEYYDKAYDEKIKTAGWKRSDIQSQLDRESRERLSDKKNLKPDWEAPGEGAMATAKGLLKQYLPDHEPSDQAVIGFAGMLKANLQKMPYAMAVRESMAEYKQNFRGDAKKDKKYWGTGDSQGVYDPLGQDITYPKEFEGLDMRPVTMPGKGEIMVEGGMMTPGARVYDPRTGKTGRIKGR